MISLSLDTEIDISSDMYEIQNKIVDIRQKVRDFAESLFFYTGKVYIDDEDVVIVYDSPEESAVKEILPGMILVKFKDQVELEQKEIQDKLKRVSDYVLEVI